MDLLVVMPTGSGKTAIMFIFALSLRRLPPGFKGYPATIDKSIVVVGMPLAMLILDQHSNPFGVKVATLSMSASLSGTADDGDSEPISLAQLVANPDFNLLFGYPEAFASDVGQNLLRSLGQAGRLFGVFIDEAHLGLPGHWESFRPGLLKKMFQVKVHTTFMAPIAIFSATITESERKEVLKLAGRKKPMVTLSVGPVQRNHKICVVKRPTSQVPFLGKKDARGRQVPGLLALLRRLVLDQFVAAVKDGPPFLPFHKSIIFFRSSEEMCLVASYLITSTGYKTGDTAPFAQNHSAVSKTDEAVLLRRKSEYLLFLTTDRMLLGTHVPGLRRVILVRPPDTEHSIVQVRIHLLRCSYLSPFWQQHFQAVGRAGRLLDSGKREQSVLYLCYNDQDLGQNKKQLTDNVRKICRSKDKCLNVMLKSMFVGEYPINNEPNMGSCCSVCDKAVP